jgi:hypothetical protein
MGVDGWTVRQDQAEFIRGTVFAATWNAGSPDWNPLEISKETDGDWSLFLQPDDPAWAENAAHTVNPSPNAGMPPGLVECEVQPAVNDQATFDATFRAIVGRRVTMTGSWVEDLSHGNKTEIHPIWYLWTDVDPDDSSLYWFAFSDASGGDATKPQLPPNAGASIRAVLERVPFPQGPAGPSRPEYTETAIVDRCEGKTLTVASNGQASPHLTGTLETGRPDAGKGMYAARITLGWTS